MSVEWENGLIMKLSRSFLYVIHLQNGERSDRHFRTSFLFISISRSDRTLSRFPCYACYQVLKARSVIIIDTCHYSTHTQRKVSAVFVVVQVVKSLSTFLVFRVNRLQTKELKQEIPNGGSRLDRTTISKPILGLI